MIVQHATVLIMSRQSSYTTAKKKRSQHGDCFRPPSVQRRAGSCQPQFRIFEFEALFCVNSSVDVSNSDVYFPKPSFRILCFGSILTPSRLSRWSYSDHSHVKSQAVCSTSGDASPYLSYLSVGVVHQVQSVLSLQRLQLEHLSFFFSFMSLKMK